MSECPGYTKNHCKTYPFYLGTVASNNIGIMGMNLVSLRIFDVNAFKTLTNQYFDMPLIGGRDGVKTYTNNIPWSN